MIKQNIDTRMSKFTRAPLPTRVSNQGVAATDDRVELSHAESSTKSGLAWETVALGALGAATSLLGTPAQAQSSQALQERILGSQCRTPSRNRVVHEIIKSSVRENANDSNAVFTGEGGSVITLLEDVTINARPALFDDAEPGTEVTLKIGTVVDNDSATSDSVFFQLDHKLYESSAFPSGLDTSHTVHYGLASSDTKGSDWESFAQQAVSRLNCD